MIHNEVSPDLMKKSAVIFVVLLGLVSLFADMTYEGARSITGPYLAVLGAHAAIVGFVAGFGEFIGYGLRVLSGYIADRTRRYWLITIAGYICNLLAVPLLALVNHWWWAAVLIVLERTGKAIRTPARDAMLSHAGDRMGMGWGFGLHQALDQTGAMMGPLLVAFVLYEKQGYHAAFALLLVPAVLALILLTLARRLYPHPQTLALPSTHLETTPFNSKIYRYYLIGAGLVAAGYADFPLIAYHFEKTKVLSMTWIPIAYAIAMGVDALASLLLGRLYDKIGFVILILVTLGACLFAPLVFLGNFSWALTGVILWAVGMGAHESLMRAAIVPMVPAEMRASAYGVFNAGFGISWFLGSVLMGVLYDISIPILVIFSVTIQLIAIPLLYKVMKYKR